MATQEAALRYRIRTAAMNLIEAEAIQDWVAHKAANREGRIASMELYRLTTGSRDASGNLEFLRAVDEARMEA